MRKYDCETGRFTSIDPLWEKYLGWSPYQYSFNNPIIWKDPSGYDGYLTINANGGGLLDGHAWISYAPTNGEVTTYGTWGNNPDGKGYGLLTNVEKDHEMNTADASRTLYINDEQEKKLNNTIEIYKSKGNDRWKLLAPCSAFAQESWLSATGEYLNANTYLIVNNPETLKNSIIEANWGKKNNIDNKNNADKSSSNQSSGQSSASSGNSSNSSVQSSFVKLPDNP